MTRHTPKHKRCTACGRNAHKVVVVFPATAPQAKSADGRVHGFCPKCWTNPRRAATVAKFGGVVVADHRAR